MNCVLDTNVLVASVSRKSPHYWIWQALLEEEITLCVTTDILNEYQEILGEFYSPAFALYILELIDQMPNVKFIKNYYFWNLITNDPDDNKFVDCAISCNASCIVSEDRHFRVLKKIPFPKVIVYKINEFETVIKRSK
jgi:uncharacterized protein